MPRHVIFRFLFTLLLILFGWSAESQELRIYSTIRDEESSDHDVIASSLSIFHAAKAYDYIDTIGEVTIFDPVHHRVIILNTRSETATEIEFDEIRQMLKVARHIIEEELDDLVQKNFSDSTDSIEHLKFQLQPRFDERYDSQKHRLTLNSPLVSYQVECADDLREDLVKAYLKYADWMCQLNYVLHPSARLPDARLVLNKILRERNLLPVKVELTSDIGGHRRLTAQHAIHWDLNSTDRKLISKWETLLKRKSTRRVTLREYQKTLLSNVNQRR